MGFIVLFERFKAGRRSSLQIQGMTVLLTFVIVLACFGDFRRSTYYRLTFSLVVIALFNMRFSCLFFSERLFFSFFQQEETVVFFINSFIATHFSFF